MSFSHPLARKARVWPRGSEPEKPQGVLVIVTTLELDSQSKKFRPTPVKRLTDAAKEWLSFNQDKASDFVLVNRPGDW